MRQTRVKGQIREMERKISLYDKYQKEQGLYFSEKDKNKLFGPQYDKAQMEMLISLKMFQQREHIAAVMIQSRWRCYRVKQWYDLITALRITAVKKIQKNWGIYRVISVGPKLVKARKFKAAIVVQKFIKGYLGNKKAIRQLMESKVEETA